MNKKALLDFTTPGGWDHNCMELIEKMFPNGQRVDNVMGWGNLNQDWWEVRDEIETSWEWCRPLSLSEEQMNKLLNLLTSGKVVMMIYYIEDNGEIIPHA